MHYFSKQSDDGRDEVGGGEGDAKDVLSKKVLCVKIYTEEAQSSIVFLEHKGHIFVAFRPMVRMQDRRHGTSIKNDRHMHQVVKRVSECLQRGQTLQQCLKSLCIRGVQFYLAAILSTDCVF